MAIYTKGGEEISEALKPSGGTGNVNVVDDYVWTLSNNRDEVPRAVLSEYQINSGQLLAGIYYYGKQISDVASSIDTSSIGAFGSQAERGGPATDNPYQFMYFASPTGFTYELPWLGSEKFARNNTFDSGEGNSGLKELGERAIGYGNPQNRTGGKLMEGLRGLSEYVAGASLLGGIASKAVVGKFGLASPQSWTETAGQNYTVSFDLINTFGDVNEIRKNRELAYLLTYQNSPFRRNFAIMDPVCIYDLIIPDVVDFPACYVSELNISNLGNTRLLNLDGKARTIPEGYRFSITFSSLIEESRNIFAGLEGIDERVKAISTERASEEIAEALGGLFDGNGGTSGDLGATRFPSFNNAS